MIQSRDNSRTHPHEQHASPAPEPEHIFTASRHTAQAEVATHRIGLWIGLLGGPVLWFTQLQTSYVLVMYARTSGRIWPMHAATVFYLLLAGMVGLIAWRAGQPRANEDRLARQRARFMSLTGLLVTAMFFIVILVQGVPSFLISPRWS
jgi:hypothetical protein